jgi:signal transduction histidine kinase
MRTLRGRVSLLALGVIAAWLFVLTLAFNLFLMHRLRSDSESALKIRAQAASATVSLDAHRQVQVRESATDSELDSDIWVYALDGRAVERPHNAVPAVQRYADSLAGSDAHFTELKSEARFYVLPVVVRDQREGTIVAASNTEAEHRAEKLALAGSAIVSLLVLAVAYPVMRLAVRRALDPVDQMARQAADWSERETSRRFGTDQRYSELRKLAGDLDGLLDRLSAVLRHERQLSGELSHELRTPLAHIAAEAELLVASGHPDDRAAHQAIADSVRSMDRIIDTLLEAARAESATLSGTCRITDVIANLGEPVTLAGDPDLTVGVDESVVERVLAPLLDNARRYARTEVRVTAARDGGSVQVDVFDDGPALSAAVSERIFEPGFRGDPADGHPGAGLGLALARRLARAADGDVAVVASTAGTVFRVTLPAG